MGDTESYAEFLNRINSFEKKELRLEKKYFDVDPSLYQKVDNDNRFKRFYGDTVVFTLAHDIKSVLSEYADELYLHARECFCERLTPDTFHVTLHDLSGSVNLCDVSEEMTRNELKITEIKRLAGKFKNEKIEMRCNAVFNMVNTSLVMGLTPVNECEYDKIAELYNIFDGIKKLPYPFTPHITLAYYNINGFDPSAAARLEKTVNRLNVRGFEFSLDVNALYYQKFTSMNDFTDVIRLAD